MEINHIMTTQRTFSIIKPDATKRNLIGKINAHLEGADLKIIAQKMVKLTKEQAEKFYAEHSERPFFSGLVSYMTSAPVVLQVLEGENAVAKNREIMGATNPEDADESTIRKIFALNIEENSIHGSDSEDSAKKEINFFFNANEIVG